MIQKIKKIIAEKKEWNRLQKRIKSLPKDYYNAMKGVQTYLFSFMYVEVPMTVFYDLLEMFETNAAEGKKVTEIVGNDLGAFCEEILKAIPESNWIDTYKKQLKNDIYKKMKKEDKRDV